jgi:hypothetical protein
MPIIWRLRWEDDLAILTDVSNSSDMSRCELDKGNKVDFTDEQLAPEDRQAMEDFMKRRCQGQP